MPAVGVKSDGTLGWMDANGNEVNPDGSPMPGAQQLRPLTNATSGQTQSAPTTTPATTTNVDIAPAGSAAAPAPAPGPVQGPPSPGTGTTPTTPQTVPGGSQVPPLAAQILSDSSNQLQSANGDVSQLWGQLTTAQQTLADLQPGGKNAGQAIANPGLITSAQSNVTAIYQALTAAEGRVESANVAKQQATQKVLDTVTLTPEQADYYKQSAVKAGADAEYARSQSQVLTDGADTQRQLAAANAAKAANDGLLSRAQADALAAKTPQDIATAKAQADYYAAQSNQLNQLLPGLVSKQAADTSLTQHQVGLTDAQSDYYAATAAKAKADAGLSDAQAKLLIPAQAAQAAGTGAEATAQAQFGIPAQAAANLANAQSTLAKIQQAQQGPLYGLGDQINAIKAIQQQVFGPGGSGDPTEANKMLQDYVSAGIAGTTPYAASVAAANAGLTQFGTQASLANAAQSAMASRANALQSAGANIFSTLGQMNANAPAGSTAMAGAFQDVLNTLGQAGNQYAPPPQQPTAPQLPPLLQKLAGVGSLGTAPTTAAAPPPGPAPGPPPAPAPAAAAAAPPGQGQGGVQINVSTSGTQNATSAGPPAGQNYGASTAYTGGVAPWNAQPGPAIPSFMQKSAPLNADQAAQYWHSLWQPELSSGAVSSPYQGANSGVPEIPGLGGGLTTPTPGAAVPTGAA